MATIADNPPAAIAQEIADLEIALHNHIPDKIDNNLLIATWNIRSFSSLTRKWNSSSSNSPKRDLRGLRAIIAILEKFDVIAVQEVKGNLRALRDTMNFLGNEWSFIMTDITLGDAGNAERLAFIFNNTRLKVSGLACELVVPSNYLGEEQGTATLNEQFARTPYAVSFLRKDTNFILTTLHVAYGSAPLDRIRELEIIAKWMRDWANRTNAYSQNLILLGDFNIDRKGDILWDTFTSTGLHVPEALHHIPRTISASRTHPSLDKFYDQIAWFQKADGSEVLTMSYVSSGSFDFLPFVYQNTNLSKISVSWRISDHYPLWCEFEL